MKKIQNNIIPYLAILFCFGVILDQLLGDRLGLSFLIEGWATMTVLTATLFIFLFFTRTISNSNIRIKFYSALISVSVLDLIFGIIIEDRTFISSIGTSLLFVLLSVHGFYYENKTRPYLRIGLKFIVYVISNLVLILYFVDPDKVYAIPGLESMSWNTAIGFLIYSSTMLSGYYDTLLSGDDVPENFRLLDRTFVYFWFLFSFSFPVLLILFVSLLYFLDLLTTKSGMAAALFCVALIPFPMTFLIYRHMFDWSKLVYRKNKKLFERDADIKFHNELLQEFAQITSHNLRGPAVGLGHLSEIAFKSDTPDDIRNQSIVLLKEKLPTLVDTIDSLAEFYNMIRQGEILYDRCNIEKLIRKAIINCRSNNLFEDFDFDLKTNFNILEVEYPEIYLENIFYNLISNSFKYKSNEKKLVIEITTHPIGRKGVELIYRDNGIGMNLEYFKTKIFHFGRSYHNFKESRGIGLFIVKSQLNRLGDSIEVNSIEGSDSFTEFTIKLNKDGKKELGYR